MISIRYGTHLSMQSIFSEKKIQKALSVVPYEDHANLQYQGLMYHMG